MKIIGSPYTFGCKRYVASFVKNALFVFWFCRPKTNAELQTTRTEYAEKFSRDLIKDLKSECSGSFEDVLVGLVEETAAYDAQLCKRAMKGLGTNEDLLVRPMLCCSALRLSNC